MSLLNYMHELQHVVSTDPSVAVTLSSFGLAVEVRGNRVVSHVFDLSVVDRCRVNPIVAILPELKRQAGGLQ